MSPEIYQPLFFLTAGIATFFIMLLGLRLLASGGPDAGSKEDTAKWLTKEELEVVQVIAETHDIKSFVFRRQKGKSFPQFLPGQFLSFQIGDDPKKTRSYSISSLPGAKYIQVSIKRLENGLGSTWFHSLAVGGKVWAYPPSGHFTDAHSQASQRIYVAGGIGITPMISMILTALESATSSQLVLFYGMRTQNDMAFHGLLSYLSSRHRNFQYFPVLSSDLAWPGDKGFLNLEFIQSKIQFQADAEFFICGPSIMSDTLIEALEKLNIDSDKIFNEKFASPVAFDPEKIPHREANIRLAGQVYKYSGKQTLLEFLESQGAYVPYACRAGVCGTCKCTVKGKFTAVTTAGLKRDEVKAGMALTCVAFPDSDLEIELA